MTLYLISVYLHILATVVWLGGMVFLALVVVPVVRTMQPPGIGAQAIRGVGRRFFPIAWTCLSTLLLTGIINLDHRGITPWDVFSTQVLGTEFGKVLAFKLGLVAAVLTLSSVHDFYIGPRLLRLMEAARSSAGEGPFAPPEDAVRLRRRLAFLARLNAVLALLVVAAAVALVRGLS